VFAAILDCGTGKPYDENTAGKSSYIFDIRYALENCTTLKDTEDYLKSSARAYAYSHLIFFADPNTSEVLENNISDNFRQIRTATSQLDSRVTWNFNNAIGSVNSFILNGNYYTHDNPANLARWDSMKTQLATKGELVTVDELKEVITYKTGATPSGQENGDLYNTYSLQTIIFQPDNLSLQIFFRPVGGLPAYPNFENIYVSF
jgi:hypothetical protein